jgi:Reverse transcriptase (RNA-dependent DNA polymerase)
MLSSVTFECCLLYLDDIIVCSKTFEHHLVALEKVFTALRNAGLKLNAKKCGFGVNRVTYLGHIISSNGVAVDRDEVQAVREFPIGSSRVPWLMQLV